MYLGIINPVSGRSSPSYITRLTRCHTLCHVSTYTSHIQHTSNTLIHLMSHVTEDLSHIGGKFVSILMLFGVHRSVKVTNNLESMNNEHFRNNFS